ncbi:hypothetical protein PQX77_012051 [Marasmius sp. AFHP31]|nr:hypothetical protein PQX77_012051 [Marasmius sp. AFHP31]
MSHKPYKQSNTPPPPPPPIPPSSPYSPQFLQASSILKGNLFTTPNTFLSSVISPPHLDPLQPPPPSSLLPSTPDAPAPIVAANTKS